MVRMFVDRNVVNLGYDSLFLEVMISLIANSLLFEADNIKMPRMTIEKSGAIDLFTEFSL